MFRTYIPYTVTYDPRIRKTSHAWREPANTTTGITVWHAPSSIVSPFLLDYHPSNVEVVHGILFVNGIYYLFLIILHAAEKQILAESCSLCIKMGSRKRRNEDCDFQPNRQAGGNKKTKTSIKAIHRSRSHSHSTSGSSSSTFVDDSVGHLEALRGDVLVGRCKADLQLHYWALVQGKYLEELQSVIQSSILD